MRSLKYGLAVAAFALGGCASYLGAGPTGDQILKKIGDRYVGRPVTELAATYGVPTEQMNFAGQHVYVWRVRNQIVWREPTSSTTQGVVKDPSGIFPGVPYSQTTTGYQATTSEYECALQVFVDAAYVVTNVGMNGKLGACDLFDR